MMKPLLHLTCLILIVSFILFPDHLSATEQPGFNDPVSEHDRALEFSVRNNFTLGSFAGSAISYKSVRSKNRANRYSLSFNNSYNTRDRERSDTETTEDQYALRFDAEVGFTRLNYSATDDNIRFYYGYGPGLAFEYRRNAIETESGTSTTTNTEYGILATALAGVEWHFHNSISLHAEYRSSFRYSRTSIESKTEHEASGNQTIQEENRRSYGMNSNGVRFGLSVYF